MDSTTNSPLADIIEENIRTIYELRARAKANRTPQERISDTVTDFSGSLSFIYLHVAWFLVWMLLNSGFLGNKAFDPFPFGLLTMIVSLEAIFLATFVLISQNRTSAEADHRADLALQIELLSEHEITRIIRMLDSIQQKLGIELHTDEELVQLEANVKPQDVLQEMDRTQHEAKRNRRFVSKK